MTPRLAPGGGDASIEQHLAEAAHLTGRLSHDFGNLLTGVLGFTELALGQVPSGTLAHRYLSEVWDVARGGADWLKNLNYFCRRTAPAFTPAGLPGALAEEQARLAPGAAAWQADVPDDLPALECDRESLRQALRQVLDNAREATAGGGDVTLRARVVTLTPAEAAALLGQPAPGRFVEITVTDNGPGLSAEARARLFRDLFFSTKPRHRGMGLLITYGIVHRFGGGLDVGAADGGGTRVRFYLPAAPEPKPAGPAQILVIDEDPQVLTDARRLLEPAGYHVSTAASPADALLRQGTVERFDLTLLAVQLGALTGPELARRLQLRDPQARFLFLHTPGGPVLPRDEMLVPDAVVHKPLTAAALLQAVAAALRDADQPT